MTLYELTDEYREALAALTDADLPEDAIRDTLEGIDGEFEGKAKAVGAMIRNIEAEASAIKAESDKMAKRARSRQNRADWLRRYLIDMMQAVDKAVLDDPLLPIKLVRNTPAVKITDPGAVPDDYMRTKTVSEPDKTAIKAALVDGLACNWAMLQTGWRVKIG